MNITFSSVVICGSISGLIIAGVGIGAMHKDGTIKEERHAKFITSLARTAQLGHLYPSDDYPDRRIVFFRDDKGCLQAMNIFPVDNQNNYAVPGKFPTTIATGVCRPT